jgi:hypothetical protein
MDGVAEEMTLKIFQSQYLDFVHTLYDKPEVGEITRFFDDVL